jgi:hypothetical protein
MSNLAPTTSLPFPAQVELASMGDGLRRWVRLRLLWRNAVSDHGGEEMAELGRQLDAAAPDAEAHAEALAGFYERHADAVNALVASSAADEGAYGVRERARKQLSSLGDDAAATLAGRARRFSDAGAGDREFLRAQVAAAEEGDVPLAARESDDRFCKAVFTLMLDAYVCCFGGVEASCGTLYGDMYERWC